jgi:AcrR family transcriptional regulator
MRHSKLRLARTRAAILQAAERLFLAQGYLVSMEDIRRAADISRATLFAHFGTKENLFRAVVKGISDREVTEILNPLVDPEEEFLTALLKFSRSFVAGVLSAERVAIYRLAIVESKTFPELAHSHYRVGIGRILPVLRDFIEGGQQKGWVRQDSPAVLAEQFAAGLLGYRQYRALLGQPEERAGNPEYIKSAILALLTPAGLMRHATALDAWTRSGARARSNPTRRSD